MEQLGGDEPLSGWDDAWPPPSFDVDRKGELMVWAIVAAISVAMAGILFATTAFVAIAQRYDAVTAGLVMGGALLVIALVSVAACLTTRHRNIERARLELAARNTNWLDPSLMAVGIQIGRAVGWRRLAAVAAVGVLAAALASEWSSRDQPRSPDNVGT